MFLFRALASGSSGNAFLLRTRKCRVLFDAGLPLSRLQRALASEEVDLDGLDAVIISHEHRDHCSGVVELAEASPATIWAHPRVLVACGLAGLKTAATFEPTDTITVGDVVISTFPVPHDAAAPVGFLIRAADRCIALVTDLGEPTADVEHAVSAADLVVLEANHDTELLHTGRYPYHLRRRVAGATGHLSNSQSARLLSARLRHDDVDVWLAHLSRENNRPALAVSAVRQALQRVGRAAVSVQAAARDRPSLRWDGRPAPRQLPLFSSLESVV